MEEGNVISEYFGLIYEKFSSIRRVVVWSIEVWSQFELLLMDFRFMEYFCLCLESWDYTTDDEDLMETMRSMITTLSVIWPNEHKGLYLLNGLVRQSWTADIKDFRTAIMEFDLKIKQSKKEIERWCENLMHSPVRKCNSSTVSETQSILRQLQMNLGLLSCYITDDIVPLEKQINFLEAKIEFLDDKLKEIEGRQCEKEIIQFLNFIHGFTIEAMCLACFYWAKEANEEIANETNIVLFDWLQKFIPFAYDITPLYVGILKSCNLQPSESVESFVDFFFQHLSTTLKDDFHVLRDRLIFLFTFLTDPPCENEKEEDLICNQIYVLLHEDSYLLLPFDEMKDDFSNNKMLLSECLIKIDIAISKIRQLYCGFSDSWIRLEVEKMDYIYFVSVHRELSSIEKHAEWADQARDQLQLYKMELRFLKMFLLCFTTWDDNDEEIKVKLSSMIASLQGIWGTKEEDGLLAPRLHAICSSDITHWYPLAFDLEGKNLMSKLEIKQWCLVMLHSSFRCKSSTTYKQILKFLDSILKNLNDLVNFKAGEIIPFKKEIETLEEKLIFLKNFSTLLANCVHVKELGEFKIFVQAFAVDAAQLTFLYWAKDANDNITSATNSLFSHALERIKPSTPNVAKLYFETLEAIYVQQSDSIMFGQTVLSFVDFFFEDSVPYLNHDFQILRDDIVFLLTFLNDHSNEMICNQIDVLFWEGVYNLLPFDDMKKDDSEKKVFLSDFMVKIETVNSNIRHIHCKFPDSTLYNFPKDVSQGFLDFLIQNLENLKERIISDRKYVPFTKYKIIQIEEELVSLCPFFNHIFGFKSEQNETWLEVVNLLYLTEHVITSCISSWFLFHRPIWYHIAYLSHVFDKTKVVKTKLEKFKENTIYNARCLPNPIGSISTPTEITEMFVGYEDDAKTITNMLTRGTMSLDIVSIVGMGGLGKTTLAKKVSSLVKGDFNVFAFCSVSQVYNTRGLLIDILHDITGDDKRNSDMTDDDLAHQLRKCLSGRKYLIVLDDIWSESAWIDVQNSFPDNKNGSRVMFTTRSYTVADKCKINCTPHQLRFFTEVESWELLQMKVFDNGISPPYLHEFGKMIAKNCKGLPLAVAVIAGLLARTEKTQRWWSEVSENVVSFLADEGCMKILELSFMHLPENLKPCLLYLGAFPEDMLIRVKQVILLWIAEGFVHGSKTRNIEDVAKEYVHDLVDRNLIIVIEKSSRGEIKTFSVHDLIHDLCRRKCVDGNFFHINHGIASSSSSDLSINNHYRVSTNNKSGVLIAHGSSSSSVTNTRSLLFFDENFDSGRLHFEFPYAQVLEMGFIGKVLDKQLTSMLHLRHINARLDLESNPLGRIIISSSISNLWNIGSLILDTTTNDVYIPESFWRLKSLRHVKVNRCVIQFPDGHEHEPYFKLVKVVSFSNIILSTIKDVTCLLQRLPVVRKLSCCLKDGFENGKESSDTLDFLAELESLTLYESVIGKKSTRSIQFPPSLKKLHLGRFKLPCTAMSNIADLNCLVVLKLYDISFPEPRLEMEDLVFLNLKYIGLYNANFVEWNASGESLPVVEQLILILCEKLKELPSCLEELSTLKRIVVRYSPETLQNSALKIKEEQKDQGNEVEVSIENVLNQS